MPRSGYGPCLDWMLKGCEKDIPHSTCIRSRYGYSCACTDGLVEYETGCFEDLCNNRHGGCDANATCTFDPSKGVTCQCKGPDWTEGFGHLNGQVCVAVRKCEVDNGGCDKHAECKSRWGQHPLCFCLDGYKGVGFQDCRDVDECTESKTPPCGTPEQHAVCTNTSGSYHCSCKKGYEGTGNYGDCQRIVIEFCADEKLNDCDPQFATCSLNEWSYVCKCKPGLEGDGTKDLCKVAEGFTSNVYCEILGYPCNEYQDCKSAEITVLRYDCYDKSAAEQIRVFLGSGPSPNTPEWVWAVVIIGCILLFGGVGFLALWAYKRAKQKDIDNERMADALDAEEDDYGAMGPPP